MSMSKEQMGLFTVLIFAVILIYGQGFLPPLFRLLKKLTPWFKGGEHKVALDGFIEIAGLRLTDDDRVRHTLISGSTGTGKSVLLEHMIYRDLARGFGALIIDPKGDRKFYENIRAFCKKIGREGDIKYLSSTNLSESVRWNPCGLGNPSELQSKFYCSARYENSFYAKASENALIKAFNKIGNKPSLTMADLAIEMDSLSQNGKDEYTKGLYFDFQNLISGEWGPILGVAPKEGNQEEVNLLHLARKNEILFVDLPTEGKSVQSSRLGALFLQEIVLLSGIRKRTPNAITRGAYPYAVYIDEFDAFATDPFISFLNKGRSSEFMITMAHQTLSDLKKVSPTFEGQLLGNINNRFVFRMDVPEDAERMAQFFGTLKSMKYTQQTDQGGATGRGSSREVLEFAVHPDTIKTLSVGQCVISVKTSKTLQTVQIPFLNANTVPHLNIPTIRQPLPTETEIFENETEVNDPYLGLDKTSGVNISEVVQ